MNPWFVNPPRALGEPLFAATIRQHCADFEVTEIMPLEFDGAGEHLYLRIEKSDINTYTVVELLQNAYDLNSADIGFSGLKDRRAVCSQWFSVCTPESESVAEKAFAELSAAGGNGQLRLLDAHRHQRKLRRGTHDANRFSIVLRDLRFDGATQADLDARIRQVSQIGFPNYLGPQRFGVQHRNIHLALQWFRKRKRASRKQRSLWLSAARSALFNHIGAARVADGSWNQLLEGEPVMLDGSRSFFSPEPAMSASADFSQRLACFDIHPSAAWWGRGESLASADCAELEARVLSEHAELCAGLEQAGLKQERRALRARAANLQHQWLNKTTLNLEFQLQPGVFATSLLRELGTFVEPTSQRNGASAMPAEEAMRKIEG
ncbi:MAG: tRNA pseudouridine(13) synthase TruD [Granulosicoccus sp.]